MESDWITSSRSKNWLCRRSYLDVYFFWDQSIFLNPPQAKRKSFLLKHITSIIAYSSVHVNLLNSVWLISSKTSNFHINSNCVIQILSSISSSLFLLFLVLFFQYAVFSSWYSICVFIGRLYRYWFFTPPNLSE